MAKAKKQHARKSLAGLKPAHKVFALVYLANGSNARKAYNEAFPSSTREDGTTDACASRLLRSAKVLEFMMARGEKILEKVESTADEAMAAIARTLRLDPRLMIDRREGSATKGKLLPLEEWPDELALVVKSFKPDGTIVFYDKLRAAELIAESEGKIKKKLDITLAFDHVKYLADKSRPKG